MTEDRLQRIAELGEQLGNLSNINDALVEVIPDMVFVISEVDAFIAAANKKCSQIGYLPQDLIGHSVDILLPERLREAHHGFMAEYWKNPIVRDMAERVLLVVDHGGEERPARISLAPVTSLGRRAVVVVVRLV